MRTKDIFKVGACCWLLADFLSDEDIKQTLNSTHFKPIYNRLKEGKKEFEVLGALALTIAKVEKVANRYDKDIISGRAINQKAEADAVSQFADSSVYLESWLDTLYRFDSEDKKQELGRLVNKAVGIVAGKEKDELTILLEWLQTQPASLSKQTIFNKVIQIKNS